MGWKQRIRDREYARRLAELPIEDKTVVVEIIDPIKALPLAERYALPKCLNCGRKFKGEPHYRICTNSCAHLYSKRVGWAYAGIRRMTKGGL
jgi:hypothetical protein